MELDGVDSEINIISHQNSDQTTTFEVFHPEILTRFQNVEYLSLWDVKMRRIALNSFLYCDKLLMIDFTSNYIQEIRAGVFRNCKALIKLILSDNRINRIEPYAFMGLEGLRLLQIWRNQLTTLQSKIFPHPIGEAESRLIFSQNPIRTIELGAFPSNTDILDLGDCRITHLHPDVFGNLVNMTWLTLEGNPLRELPPGLFNNAKLLNWLNLQFTNITRLNSNSFISYSYHLSIIDLSHSGLNEIQPGFFNNFPNLFSFGSLGNRCADISFLDLEALQKCFDNWLLNNA